MGIILYLLNFHLFKNFNFEYTIWVLTIYYYRTYKLEFCWLGGHHKTLANPLQISRLKNFFQVAVAFYRILRVPCF